MKRRYILPTTLMLTASAALAERMPPQSPLPLPHILALLEERYDIGFIDDVAWVDQGYWAVELVTRQGRELAVNVDPVTGHVIR